MKLSNIRSIFKNLDLKHIQFFVSLSYYAEQGKINLVQKLVKTYLFLLSTIPSFPDGKFKVLWKTWHFHSSGYFFIPSLLQLGCSSDVLISFPSILNNDLAGNFGRWIARMSVEYPVWGNSSPNPSWVFFPPLLHLSEKKASFKEGSFWN